MSCCSFHVGGTQTTGTRLCAATPFVVEPTSRCCGEPDRVPRTTHRASWELSTIAGTRGACPSTVSGSSPVHPMSRVSATAVFNTRAAISSSVGSGSKGITGERTTFSCRTCTSRSGASYLIAKWMPYCSARRPSSVPSTATTTGAFMAGPPRPCCARARRRPG